MYNENQRAKLQSKNKQYFSVANYKQYDLNMYCLWYDGIDKGPNLCSNILF